MKKVRFLLQWPKYQSERLTSEDNFSYIERPRTQTSMRIGAVILEASLLVESIEKNTD